MVTFEEYTEFGYDVIPEEKFHRFMFKVGGLIEKWTLGRVTDEILKQKDDTKLVERNKRGLCEIAELVFRNDNPAIGESGAPIRSFSNDGYSETLVNTGVRESSMAFEREAMNILTAYFTSEQICRRGDV